jgi:quercetin dioxygenase-like cupin family protein
MSDTPEQHDCTQPWTGNLTDQVQFADRGIVSKTLVDCDKAKIVLFAMKTGQALSPHAAGTPATIHVLQGAGKIMLDGTFYEGTAGSLYYMPAGLLHSVESTDDLVFLLNLFR